MSVESSPFSEKLKPYERSGALKDIFEVTKGSDNFIIKKYAHLVPGQKRVVNLGSFSYEIDAPEWLEDEPPVGSFEFSLSRKREYEILRGYMGKYIADTVYIYGEDEMGQKSNFEVQKKVEGRSLSKIGREKILQNSDLMKQIVDFAKKSLRMFEEIGWLPDVHEDIMSTDNLIYSEDNKLICIDTDSVYKLPRDLVEKFRSNLYDRDGALNPELLEELKNRGLDQRYLGDISLTFASIFEIAKADIESESDVDKEDYK